jgi:hypothetical protein
MKLIWYADFIKIKGKKAYFGAVCTATEYQLPILFLTGEQDFTTLVKTPKKMSNPTCKTLSEVCNLALSSGAAYSSGISSAAR